MPIHLNLLLRSAKHKRPIAANVTPNMFSVDDLFRPTFTVDAVLV